MLLLYKSFCLEPNYKVILFVFLATIFVYTFQRYGKLKINLAFSGPRLDWMLRNIFLVKLVMALSFIGAGVIAINFNFKTLLFLSPLVLVALLYVGKFPFKFPFNLRDIPFIKAHLIALTWAGITVVIPAVELELIWQNDLAFFFLAVYLFIFSLAIVFDIRDVNLDEPSKRTVPQLLGVKGALLLSVCLCSLGFGLFFVAGNYDACLFVCLLILVLAFMLNSIKKKDDLYYSFYLDGLILVTGSTLSYLVY